MREGWSQTTLGEAAEITMGQSPPGESYNTEGKGLPFIQGSAEFGSRHPTPVKWCTSPKKVAQTGDLLLSVRAPVGDMNFADSELAIGRGLSVIRGTESALVEFLALAVENAMSELKSRSAGGMFESLTAAGLKGLPLSIPPLAEQRRIVDLIGAVDEATAPAAAAWSAMGDSLTSIATSLYEQAPGRKKITETCDLLVGFAFRSTTFTDDERCVRLLRGDNIIPGGLRWKGVQRFNGEIGEILDRYLLEAGDIVLAMDRPVINGGVKVARVEEGDVPSLLVQRVARLRPRDPGMTPLLHALLVAAPFQSYLEAVQTGGHAPHISAGLIRDFDVPDLNEESASIASGVLGALLEAERAATLEYKRLLMLRSALLSDLLSGSHEIPASYDSLLEMVS